MLYLIGLGLDKEDISLKALKVIKNCKRVFLEYYTSDLPYSFSDIEKVINRKIDIVDRKFVEEENVLVEEAKRHDVALLIPGDPLTATTHSELMLRANKFGVECRIIHAPSVLTAVADTGLQLYKFGKIASIPKWQKSFIPDSFYNIIQDNRRINAHTLLLIDIGLSVNEALKQLKEVSDKRNDKLEQKEKIIICSRIGTEKAEIIIGKIPELIKKNIKLPACIILPSPLHFFEEEMLKRLKARKHLKTQRK